MTPADNAQTKMTPVEILETNGVEMREIALNILTGHADLERELKSQVQGIKGSKETRKAIEYACAEISDKRMQGAVSSVRKTSEALSKCLSGETGKGVDTFFGATAPLACCAANLNFFNELAHAVGRAVEKIREVCASDKPDVSGIRTSLLTEKPIWWGSARKSFHIKPVLMEAAASVQQDMANKVVKGKETPASQHISHLGDDSRVALTLKMLTNSPDIEKDIMRPEVVASLQDDLLYLTQWRYDFEKHLKSQIKSAVNTITTHDDKNENRHSIAKTLDNDVFLVADDDDAEVNLSDARKSLVVMEQPDSKTVFYLCDDIKNLAYELVSQQEAFGTTMTWAVDDAVKQGYDEDSVIRGALDEVMEASEIDGVTQMCDISSKSCDRLATVVKEVKKTPARKGAGTNEIQPGAGM